MDTNTVIDTPAENILQGWLAQYNLPPDLVTLISSAITCLLVLMIAALSTLVVRRIFLPVVQKWIRSNKYTWDDPILDNGLVQKASWFISVMVISISVDALLEPGTTMYIMFKRLAMAAHVVVAIFTITAFLDTVNDIHKLLRKHRKQYLQACVDAGKIITYVLGVIFIASIFTGKSPLGIFSVLGGLTAVTMLIFKDSILGFVASLQLTATDMIQVGDWIEMPQYGADGDVLSMTIHSVKVQNWDKTVTTIPTHALVASSFKNWRGMKRSGGRRIKRPILIDISSIRFCDEEMLARFEKIRILEEYLKQKKQEITEEAGGQMPCDINGRRQTNIGVFRAYVVAYLRNNHNIHQNMTFLVRQLPPGTTGLPLEIYVFSKDTLWANYEAIQADIFDHLLAVIPEFELRVFQSPTGRDLHLLAEGS